MTGTAAYAQQTGSISGKVSDSSGAVLPGVTVEARSDVLPGPRVTVTESDGNYQLPALPPGTYTVTYTLQGMQTVTRQVTVSLNQITTSDASLNVGGVAESVPGDGDDDLRGSDVGGADERHVQRRTGQAAHRNAVPRSRQQHSRRAVHAAAGARPERRRQRPEQRLQLRRRQRDDAALRHAVGRARLAGRRGVHGREGGRHGDRLQSRGRVLDQHDQQVGDEPVSRRGELPLPAGGHVRRAEQRQPLGVRREPRLHQRQRRRADHQGQGVLLRLVLSPHGEPRQLRHGLRPRAEPGGHAQRGIREGHADADAQHAVQRQLPRRRTSSRRRRAASPPSRRARPAAAPRRGSGSATPTAPGSSTTTTSRRSSTRTSRTRPRASRTTSRAPRSTPRSAPTCRSTTSRRWGCSRSPSRSPATPRRTPSCSRSSISTATS